jgi:hypothetical protein
VITWWNQQVFHGLSTFHLSIFWLFIVVFFIDFFLVRYPNGTTDRIVGPPDPLVPPRDLNLHGLDRDGIVHVGALVLARDVLVNKQRPINMIDPTNRPDALSDAQYQVFGDFVFRPPPLFFVRRFFYFLGWE